MSSLFILHLSSSGRRYCETQWVILNFVGKSLIVHFFQGKRAFALQCLFKAYVIRGLFSFNDSTGKTKRYMGALPSLNIVPFIELHSSYNITLRRKKTKCTKARHENAYKQAGGKNGKRVSPTKLRNATLGILGDTMWKVLHTNMQKLPKEGKIYIFNCQEYYKSHSPPRTTGKKALSRLFRD